MFRVIYIVGCAYHVFMYRRVWRQQYDRRQFMSPGIGQDRSLLLSTVAKLPLPSVFWCLWQSFFLYLAPELLHSFAYLYAGRKFAPL